MKMLKWMLDFFFNIVVKITYYMCNIYVFVEKQIQLSSLNIVDVILVHQKILCF